MYDQDQDSGGGDWWAQNAPPVLPTAGYQVPLGTPATPGYSAPPIAAVPGGPNYHTVEGWANPNSAPTPDHPFYQQWLAANPGYQPAGGGGAKPAGSAQAFIAQWQASHPVSSGMGPLLAAMKAAGYNVSPYMYGATPSNNEITVDGVKTKLIAGEGTAGANWFAAGTDDGGGRAAGNPLSMAGLDAASFGAAPAAYHSQAWTGGDFVDPTMSEVTTMPGYQTRLDQGILGQQRSAAANGTILNGGTAKALTRYNQDYATNEYQTARGNKLQSYMQRYGQFQDDNSRRLGDYTVNTANTRNSQNDYWSRLRDLYSTGASTAAGSYKPG